MCECTYVFVDELWCDPRLLFSVCDCVCVHVVVVIVGMVENVHDGGAEMAQ